MYNYLGEYGANKLIKTIQNYWKDKNIEFRLEVDKLSRENASSEKIYMIRSDMINGMPRD